MAFQSQVIIAGGGPTGLFLALRLVLRGIRVTVLEKDAVLHPAVRALGYFGPVHFALQRAGIFNEVQEKALFLTGFSWRKRAKQDGPNEKQWGDLIAAWNPWELSALEEGDCGCGLLCLGQDKLREIIMSKLIASDLAQVLLGHEVIGLSQGEHSATITTVDVSGAEKQFTAPFVIGADGGKSRMRNLMGLPLDGFTWPETIIASDIYVNFSPPKDGMATVYVIDPVDWAFICPLAEINYGGSNLYRCTFPMSPEECEPAVFDDCLKKKFERMFPGARPLKYELRRCQQYRSHQRQVPNYLVGRSILVGDAAHLNAPWGGLGLTTGLLDADSLADALNFVINDGKPLSILRSWADARHAVFKDFINPVSTANKLRCHDTNPDDPKSDPFLKAVMEQDSSALQEVNAGLDRMATDMADIVMGQSLSNL
ncbi:Uncharacterized protein BP5553_01294 [Venustampulla echinocandica]|uniref:FAD-binding domain-containing protein n=1 Tax=Venustampulla echinocandica TaxID=2656787 RepID=A0A370U0M1_9HELO|nr:Uncharacterized protein BP5553_01294 [Venustampulla echinocandica]RDL41315.1 Uncharacterized protein BP5553_01294 [Venustampulla echinocandica]